MQSKYNYVLKVKRFGIEKEQTVPSIRQLAEALSISIITARKLVYGGNTKWSKYVEVTKTSKSDVSVA